MTTADADPYGTFPALGTFDRTTPRRPFPAVLQAFLQRMPGVAKGASASVLKFSLSDLQVATTYSPFAAWAGEAAASDAATNAAVSSQSRRVRRVRIALPPSISAITAL
jgi:hypothetical protein